MNLIQISAKLQQAIIATIVASTAASLDQDASLMLIPYYHWALTGISQLFKHPAWAELDLDIPSMDEELLGDQAIQAFDYAEKRKNHPEAVLYLPIINIIALEMKSKLEQQRVRAYMETLRSRGFGIVSRLEAHLPSEWQA